MLKYMLKHMLAPLKSMQTANRFGQKTIFQGVKWRKKRNLLAGEYVLVHTCGKILLAIFRDEGSASSCIYTGGYDKVGERERWIRIQEEEKTNKQKMKNKKKKGGREWWSKEKNEERKREVEMLSACSIRPQSNKRQNKVVTYISRRPSATGWKLQIKVYY